MSRAIVDTLVTRPVGSVIGEIVSEMSMSDPSFRTRCVSKGVTDSLRAAAFPGSP